MLNCTWALAVNIQKCSNFVWKNCELFEETSIQKYDITSIPYHKCTHADYQRRPECCFGNIPFWDKTRVQLKKVEVEVNFYAVLIQMELLRHSHQTFEKYICDSTWHYSFSKSVNDVIFAWFRHKWKCSLLDNIAGRGEIK